MTNPIDPSIVLQAARQFRKPRDKRRGPKGQGRVQVMLKPHADTLRYLRIVRKMSYKTIAFFLESQGIVVKTQSMVNFIKENP